MTKKRAAIGKPFSLNKHSTGVSSSVCEYNNNGNNNIKKA